VSNVLLYVTASSEDEAARIGRVLVEERLAACANVIPGMRAIYRWDGGMQDEKETVLIAKTRDSLADSATARIKALHSYAVPCIVVLPISGGNGDFLDWIEAETDEDKK
jgi:periplasmic divalent cation tolerance protein